MRADVERAYESLCDHARQTAVLSSLEELVGWDERTYMPPAAGEYRAEQLTCLAGLVHERRTDPQLGEWLALLADSPLVEDPHSPAGTTIREMTREYDKRVKLPQRLVEELARATVLGQQAWVRARESSDFSLFEPILEQIVSLKREQATVLAGDGPLYDALLDDFEPGETTENVAGILEALRRALVPLVAAVGSGGRRPDTSMLHRRYAVDTQASFGRDVAEQIGFDFQRGRIDTTHHPFCASMGPCDCRITTRYDANSFPAAFFGILHEAGHGLYDQGLPSDHYGLPPGNFVSLGIHESQSRMWENQVGRSRPFWQYLFPAAQRAFPSALGDVALEPFFFAINEVRPSLIRVEADEATYNLHIIVRFELEQALLDGSLNVAELPGAWNEKYEEYLGIVPSTDAEGVLQDIHWSAGLIGYFPTYALGNLYAAQFFARADEELGGFDKAFRRGDFGPLLDWLRTNIHAHGQCYSARDLVRRITGQPLESAQLVRHLREKLEPLYGIS